MAFRDKRLVAIALVRPATRRTSGGSGREKGGTFILGVISVRKASEESHQGRTEQDQGPPRCPRSPSHHEHQNRDLLLLRAWWAPGSLGGL